jgi:phosphatidylglycerophosphate synthase
VKLHRTGKVADWETVPAAQHNSWQKLAVATDGLLTPGNIVSSIGLGLVFAGLIAVARHDYWLGLGLVASGRLADILDGLLADRSGTKSPLGEVVDASFDKVGALATLAVFAIEGLLPWAIAVIIGLQSVANVTLALYARTKGLSLHPSKVGKLSAVGVWICILAFAVAKPVHQQGWHSAGNFVTVFSYIFATAAIIFSLCSTVGYAKDAKLLKQQGR